MSEYEYYMALALDEADKALKAGEFPVGCVIASRGRVVSTGSRRGTASSARRASEIDHAEIRALKRLETEENAFDPGEAVVFCTMEPCLMCFGAILLSGIKTIVYAYEDVMGGGTGCDLTGLPVLYSHDRVAVIPGVMRSRSLALFQNFFKNPDNHYWKGSVLEQYTLDQKNFE
ncbi:MAG: nucleoside deaminase [Desulfobacteraceae bacterium]